MVSCIGRRSWRSGVDPESLTTASRSVLEHTLIGAEPGQQVVSDLHARGSSPGAGNGLQKRMSGPQFLYNPEGEAAPPPPPPPPSTHAPTAQPPSLPRPDWAAGMRMEKATAAKAVGQDRPASTRAEEKQAKILVLPGPAQQGCVSRAEGFRYSSKCPMLLQSLPHPHPSVPA